MRVKACLAISSTCRFAELKKILFDAKNFSEEDQTLTKCSTLELAAWTQYSYVNMEQNCLS